MIKMVKKIVSIFVFAVILILSGLIIHKNGMGIEEHRSRLEEIPINNDLYMLNDGSVMEQIFITENDYLVGIELIVVNILDESTGQLVVQLADMWGDSLKEVRLDLNSMPVGEYFRITFDTELDWESNEEYRLRIYAENANISPALICVHENQGIEENSLCCFNGELIESSLVVGYVYGTPKYVGYQYWERAKIQYAAANVILILLIGVILICAVNFARWEKIKKKLTDINMYYQITVISVIFSVFLLSALVNKINTDVIIPVGVYIWLLLTAILLAGTVLLYLWNLDQGKIHEKSRTYLTDPHIWIIIIFSVVIRLPMFTQIQKWDSSAYYGGVAAACRYFDYTFASVWDYFRIASHPTFAFTFFCAIGEFLIPDKVTGVLIIQLNLTVSALICIYHMLRGYWCNMPSMPSMLVVLLLSIIPIFWGTFSIVNVDYYLILFFIFMVYSDYRKYEILRFGWMVAVMLTKETGWMIVAGYIAACLVMLWQKEKEESLKVKMKRLGKEPLVQICVLGIIIICLYVVKQGSLFSWFDVGTKKSFFVSGKEIKERGLGINAVGVYLPYILHKLAQIFILNFMWIPSGIIISSCVIIAKGRMKYRKKIRNLESSIGALVLFILFNIFFVTVALSRYTVFSAVMIWLIASILAYYIIIPRLMQLLPGKVLAGLGGVLAVVLCIQNFAYIDPFSNLIFQRLDSGKGTILSTDMNLNGYGDTLINNYRYSYVDKLLDKLLKTVEYNSDMQVIALGEGDTYPIYGMKNYVLGWDLSKQRRISLNVKDDDIISINLLYLTDLEANEVREILPRAVVYFLKYCEYDEESYLKRLEPYYVIGERQELDNWGGTLSYYVLERKTMSEVS